VNSSAFLGSPTWSPKIKRLLGGNVRSVMFLPSSSRTYIWWVWDLFFSSVSKAVLSLVMPGWDLPARVFLRICCQVSMLVRTS